MEKSSGNPSKAKTLRDLIDDPDFEGQEDDLLSNIENVDNFEKDPRLLGFAKDHPDFFKNASFCRRRLIYQT